MSRLFITPREQQFINDVTKEYIKDIVGQYVLLFPVSMINTRIDPVYEEAVQKIFERQIKVDCIASQTSPENSYTTFGLDSKTEVEILIQPRDLIDKGITISTGDFFIYGASVFEIHDLLDVDNVFGQNEYSRSIKITGRAARVGQIDLPAFRQLLRDAKIYKESEVQKTFEQQRGLKETSTDGNTGDKRQIRERLGNEMDHVALGEGPRQILQEENEQASTFEHSSHSLYEDD